MSVLLLLLAQAEQVVPPLQQVLTLPLLLLPMVTQTLVLVQNEGLSTQVEQYVRATTVSVVDRVFFDPNSNQDYSAKIVTVGISDSLRTDFTGSPPARSFTRASNGTLIRDTIVADAGTYVAPSRVEATATTVDVRGTYAYAGTANGTNVFTVMYLVDNGPSNEDLFGVAQFAG
jgi:hypothetical protein